MMNPAQPLNGWPGAPVELGLNRRTFKTLAERSMEISSERLPVRSWIFDASNQHHQQWRLDSRQRMGSGYRGLSHPELGSVVTPRVRCVLSHT
jgi:hypothetical protein